MNVSMRCHFGASEDAAFYRIALIHVFQHFPLFQFLNISISPILQRSHFSTFQRFHFPNFPAFSFLHFPTFSFPQLPSVFIFQFPGVFISPIPPISSIPSTLNSPIRPMLQHSLENTRVKGQLTTATPDNARAPRSAPVHPKSPGTSEHSEENNLPFTRR